MAPLFPLGWSHYVELQTLDDCAERHFYEIETAANQWSVRVSSIVNALRLQEVLRAKTRWGFRMRKTEIYSGFQHNPAIFCPHSAYLVMWALACDHRCRGRTGGLRQCCEFLL